jgi:hypothetical protein
MYKAISLTPQRKRPLEECRWEDMIKIDVREIGCGGVWTEFKWLRISSTSGFVKMVIKPLVP